MITQGLDRLAHIGALVFEVIRHRGREPAIRDVVDRIGGNRPVASGQLVFALGARFDARKTALQGEIDGLVVADLEMQERMFLDGAPVAPVERVVADEVDGAGDVAACSFGHDEKHPFRHGGADQREEAAVQIRPAPLPRSGVHVERVEGVPVFFAKVSPRDVLDRDAGCQRIPAFALDRLALARCEGRQEIIEAAVAVVDEVELLIGPLQPALGSESLPFGLRHERRVDRGRLGLLAQGAKTRGELGLPPRQILVAGHEKPPPRCGREGNRHLQLGVIAAAGPREGIGPGMVEDIFPLRVALEVGRGGCDEAAGVPDHDMGR